MNTIEKIIDQIIERHSAYLVTDDYPVDRELIKDMCNDIRESLIRDSYRRTGMIDQRFYVRKCCFEIVCHNDDCSVDGITIPSGHTEYKVVLPEMVSGIGKQDLIYVGDNTGLYRFTEKSYGSFVRSDNALFTSGKPIFTRFTGMIFLKNLPTAGMKFICLNYLPKDPTVSCNMTTSDEYPVPSTTSLIEMVLDKLITDSMGQKDNTNDTDDGIVNPKISAGMLQKMRNQQNKQQGNE